MSEMTPERLQSLENLLPADCIGAELTAALRTAWAEQDAARAMLAARDETNRQVTTALIAAEAQISALEKRHAVFKMALKSIANTCRHEQCNELCECSTPMSGRAKRALAADDAAESTDKKESP